MKGAALKVAIAAHAAGIAVTPAEQDAALLDAFDLFFDLLGDVKRIADAAETLATCVQVDAQGPNAFTTINA
jgi:hypothetical protein